MTDPPPNQAPTAAFTRTETDLSVSVNGSDSTDADGTIASYSWNCGDGSPTGSGVTASHTVRGGRHLHGHAHGDRQRRRDRHRDRRGHGDGASGRPGLRQGRLRADGRQRLGHRRPRRRLDGVRDPARWSVGAGVGSVSLTAGNGGTATLPSVSKTDTEVAATLSPSTVATGGGQYVSVLARQVSANNDYRAKLQIRSDGTVTVVITQDGGGTGDGGVDDGRPAGGHHRGERQDPGPRPGGRLLADDPAGKGMEGRNHRAGDLDPERHGQHRRPPGRGIGGVLPVPVRQCDQRSDGVQLRRRLGRAKPAVTPGPAAR